MEIVIWSITMISIWFAFNFLVTYHEFKVKSKLGWLIIVWFVPIIGLILYFILEKIPRDK